jgi:hypothetical protein
MLVLHGPQMGVNFLVCPQPLLLPRILHSVGSVEAPERVWILESRVVVVHRNDGAVQFDRARAAVADIQIGVIRQDPCGVLVMNP